MHMPAKRTRHKGLALGLTWVLFCLAMAGCTGTAPGQSSSAASSSVKPPVSQPPASSSAKPPASLPAQAQSRPLQKSPLTGTDFSVFQNGQMVLDPQTVAFARFSYLQNAAINRLDPAAVSTRRGLKLGEGQARIEELYAGLPVNIVTNGPEGPLLGAYEDYAAFLQGEAAGQNHHAIYHLYLVDGKPEADPAAIQNVLAANAYSPKYGVLRYDLDFDIQNGKIFDIVLTTSNITPYFLGYIQPQVLLDNEQCSITATAITNQNGMLCLGLGIQNKTGQAVVAVATATTVNGKMPREMGVLNQPLGAGGYADTLLTIPIEAARAAGVDMVDSVGFTLQLQTTTGQVLFDSGGLTVPVINQAASSTSVA